MVFFHRYDRPLFELRARLRIILRNRILTHSSNYVFAMHFVSMQKAAYGIVVVLTVVIAMMIVTFTPSMVVQIASIGTFWCV